MKKNEQQIRRSEGILIMGKVMAAFDGDHRLKEFGKWWLNRQEKLFLLESRANARSKKTKPKTA